MIDLLPTMKQRLDTPHNRETDLIAAVLDEIGAPGEEEALARGLQGLSGWPGDTGKSRALLLAVALTHDELLTLLIAVKHSPKPRRDWRNRISIGHHARSECLERPGEWCRGIGKHPGRCDSCPTLKRHANTVARLVGKAVELRREIDAAMWAGTGGER